MAAELDEATFCKASAKGTDARSKSRGKARFDYALREGGSRRQLVHFAEPKKRLRRKGSKTP